MHFSRNYQVLEVEACFPVSPPHPHTFMCVWVCVRVHVWSSMHVCLLLYSMGVKVTGS